MQEHGESTAEFSSPTELAPPDWLEKARAKLPGPGRYLACRTDGGEIEIFEIERGWTRIGRSVAADIPSTASTSTASSSTGEGSPTGTS
jgi:hypothetical protein